MHITGRASANFYHSAMADVNTPDTPITDVNTCEKQPGGKPEARLRLALERFPHALELVIRRSGVAETAMK
jgi:hypothetical protein